MWVAGAPRNVAGENTMTKLMPRFCQSSVRRLAIRAVMLRPSTLTVTGSPTFRPSPSRDLLLERDQRWPGLIRRATTRPRPRASLPARRSHR